MTFSDWEEVDRALVNEWNGRLLATSASLFQYPYWNEALVSRLVGARYLVWRDAGKARSYVCILAVGMPGFRIGLVRRGPVALDEKLGISDEMLQKLFVWARRNGHIFLRVTDSDERRLCHVAQVLPSVTGDAFPFHRDLREELLVMLNRDEHSLLMSFQKVARQEIRKAVGRGYEVECSGRYEAFSDVWPLFVDLAKRKGFTYRPLASYRRLVANAMPESLARTYIARLDGVAVEAVLVVRDSRMALYMSGALAVEMLEGGVSPSCLLQWRAMNDAAELGAREYSLGSRSGVVYQFKRKFRPVERMNPVPVTVVCDPLMYRVWSGLLGVVGAASKGTSRSSVVSRAALRLVRSLVRGA